MVVFIDRHKHFADRPEINEYMIERKWIILRSTCGEVESSSSNLQQELNCISVH